MQIIIKGLRGFDVFPENKEYIEKRFLKFCKRIKEPTILEFSFDHTHGTRANIDKCIHLTVSIPGVKTPEHFEETAIHFSEAVDKLEERFEKFLLKWKDKVKIGERRARE
jgi:ribosome-associated translation inhibitor RaiA